MFTVVIPLYNKELSIQNTIQSVLNQTCQDFEIVVINDGSTDNSAKIVESIEDHRICLIHQPNQGVSAARNRGIKEAKCEWIALLDGDDLWEINHLEEINKMMDVFPSEKVYVTSFEYSDGREMFKHPRQTTIFKIDNYFKEAIKETIICASNVIIYKSCFDEVGGFNEMLKYGEDLDLWARLAETFQIIKSSAVTTIYRVDAENRSHLNQRLEHCFEYHLQLSGVHDLYASQYISFVINEKLYSYLRRGQIKNFFELKKKQQKSCFTLSLLKNIIYSVAVKFGQDRIK